MIEVDTGVAIGNLPSTSDVQSNRRVLFALCVAGFLAALNFFAVTPFYAQMARDLDTTVPLLGQAATLMGLLSAGLGLVVGPLADRYGYRIALVIGTFAIAVSLVGTGLAISYPMLLGLAVLGGLGDALVFGLSLAIAGTLFSGDQRRRAMAWTLGSMSSAPIIGVPVLTTIGGIAGWRTALVSAGLSVACATWFIAVALPSDRRQPTSRFALGELIAAYVPLLRHPPSLRLFGAAALRGVAWLGAITYLGAFLGDEVGLGTRQIGLVYTATGVGYAVGSIVVGRGFRVVRPRVAVAVTCTVVGIGVVLMSVLATFWQATALMLVMSFAASFAGVSIASLLVSESPAGTGTTMVLNGSMVGLGGTGGAALGGGLIAVGGYDALALGLPIFALLAAALAWWPSERR